MTTTNLDMIDLLFDLSGSTLPATYHQAMWNELVRLAPKLADEQQVGVLPLHSYGNNQNIRLSKRSKLTIRLPSGLSDYVISSLTGTQLDIIENPIQIGSAKKRVIEPYPTIHAHTVVGNENEVLFVGDIENQLKAMNISGKIICGKSYKMQIGERPVRGYSLVIFDLKPDASLQLQKKGLGSDRHLGCGNFVHYKLISGLKED